MFRSATLLKANASSRASPAQQPTVPTRKAAGSSSQQHHDLASFIQHATREGLSPTSTVYTGTYYEYLVAASLARFGFRLDRTGGAHDLGIDLLGTWDVPSAPRPLRVLLQCKAHRRKLAPENLRELEGAFGGAPAAWRGDGVLGFLVSKGAASKGVIDALQRSRSPIGFMQCDDAGVVRQFLWNHAAQQWGLQGLGVTTRFVSPDPGVGVKEKGATAVGGVEKEITLTWNGWMIQRSLEVKEDGEDAAPETQIKRRKQSSAR